MEINREREEDQERGLLFLRILTILAVTALASRLFFLQIIRGEYYRGLAEGNRLRRLSTEAPRGAVFDRHGRVLVRNSSSFVVSVVPAEMEKRKEVLDLLRELLQLSPKEMKEKLTKSPNPFDVVRIRENLSQNELAILAERMQDLPGVTLEPRPVRKYVHGTLAAHFLGYVGQVNEEEIKRLKEKGIGPGDTVGKDGVEQSQDEILRGVNGIKQIEVDAAGRIVKTLGEIDPVPGNDLFLTIDLDLQRAAEEGLSQTLDKLKVQNGVRNPGAVVALDPRDGSVLALTSAPAYDPNLFARGIKAREYQDLLSNPFYPLLNRAIAGAYPSGSTFKIVTGSAGLQEKVISPDQPYYCGGVFTGAGIPFNCFVRSGHGSLAFVEALGLSCDVYFYNVGFRLGIQRLDRYATDFGVGRKTGIDLPGESPGLLPTEEWKRKTYHDEWYAGETVNLAIGQGYLQLTPIQLAVMGSIIASRGKVFQPHLFGKAVSPQGEEIRGANANLLRSVKVSPEMLTKVALGMKAAVDHGTGTAAKLEKIAVAGKTGTAENLPSAENPRGRNHAWFVCFAPFENPEIVVAVCLEQSGGFGGQWAAPIARKVLEQHFGLSGKHLEPAGRTGD